MAFKDTQAKASVNVILDATGNQPTHILTYLVSKAVTPHHLASRDIWGPPRRPALSQQKHGGRLEVTRIRHSRVLAVDSEWCGSVRIYKTAP